MVKVKKKACASLLLASLITLSGCAAESPRGGQYQGRYFPWEQQGEWLKRDLKYLNDTNTGYWSGIYTEEIETVESMGDATNTIGWFENLDSFSENKIKLCLDEGKYNAFITLQPQYNGTRLTCSEILSGEYDDILINYFKELSKGSRVRHEVLIRFAHEMERLTPTSFWYAWQELPENSQLYIDMWQHVVTLGREYAPNVKWVWSPNRYRDITRLYYPGDDWVDYIGLTLNKYWQTSCTFQYFYEELGQRAEVEKYNKPIFFSEAGITGTPEEKIEYLQGLFSYLEAYKDKSKGIIIFDFNTTEWGERNYKFTDKPDEVEKYRKFSYDYLHPEPLEEKESEEPPKWNETIEKVKLYGWE